MTITASAKQWTATQERDNLKLIPPLADEFSLYGGADTVERARKWALDGHYLLATGIPACAHGLYLMASCPDCCTCRNHFPQLDHANVWIPASPNYSERPFLLSHPYAATVSTETRMYATAHGLGITEEPWRFDSWYGSGTIPVRMTIPGNWPLWPIEAKALVLLSTQPVSWPDSEAEA
jgi:hypothetical protein